MMATEKNSLYELHIDLNDCTWYKKANCQGVDTETFFLNGSGGEYPKIARRICSNCVVKNECLEFAVKYRMQGFWGGTTETDRNLLRSKLKVS